MLYLRREIKHKFLNLTWEDVERLSHILCDKMAKENYVPDIIVAVMRGGWVPARIVLDMLKISGLAAIEIKFYKGIGEARERPILTQPLVVSVRDKKVLIIDDVVDTGKSLSVAVETLKLYGPSQIKTAALVVKPWSIVMPDYYALKSDAWVIFPWELRETVEELVNTLEIDLNKCELDELAQYISEKTGLRKDLVLKTLKFIKEHRIRE